MPWEGGGRAVGGRDDEGRMRLSRQRRMERRHGGLSCLNIWGTTNGPLVG